MAEHEKDGEDEGGVELLDRREERVEKPRMWRVVILNDDFTPVDFVVELVAVVFRKSPEDAAAITLEVHHKGSAVAGVYTYEIAETRIAIAHAHAKKNEHPLQLTMEPEE
jgi:ATP-dependent Clp protease adaptor protein ClpS